MIKSEKTSRLIHLLKALAPNRPLKDLLHYEKTYRSHSGASSDGHVSDFLHHCGERASYGDHDHHA
jgi:hypothetical protein